MPEEYQSYVDLVPATWTKVEKRGSSHAGTTLRPRPPRPTLVANDVKTGADARGAIALWIDVGTEAHFRNLTVTPWSK